MPAVWLLHPGPLRPGEEALLRLAGVPEAAVRRHLRHRRPLVQACIYGPKELAVSAHDQTIADLLDAAYDLIDTEGWWDGKGEYNREEHGLCIGLAIVYAGEERGVSYGR